MKLKAFSILELMVAILISGIIISAAFSVFIFSNKQFFKFTAIKTDIRDYFELSSSLKRDFEMAKKVIKKSDEQVEMQLTDKNIIYQFGANYITRTTALHSDTFMFSSTNIELNMLTNNNENLIDYLKLDVKDNTLSFHKDYGAIAKLEE
ncbi:MAG: prepilin-type N-terminal cleavage/methylation domain-containing protein [Flavobacteriales bacterium]|nr:MAG: prepilin-type N-terminal cleavage/methylation domain-containing protein [Flavobacteriales bacterium]